MSRRRPPRLRAYLTDERGRVRRERRGRLLVRAAGGAQAADRRSASTSATTRSACTRSSAATPTRTTSGVYRWLLERTCKLYAVAFAVDRLGDIYLDARLPLAVGHADELDRLLGAVLAYRRRVVQHDPRAGLRLLDPQGVGVAQRCAASRPRTSRRSAAGWSPASEPSARRRRTATSASSGRYAPARRGSGG